ncbi:MAG: glycosyltransferase [Alphaproteobacteria bacterium]|nr:glycosyltransferase [Alphaproteobacteria bacterium]
MKIALGHRIQTGPWGGGNRFAASLAQALLDRGDQLVFTLDHQDIDLILLVDPRSRNPAVPFTPGQVFRYRRHHPKVRVLHRINECDQRKGTRSMNVRLKLANYVADHTVFISRWLSGLDLWRRDGGSSVIMNGADETIFNSVGHVPWDGNEPIRLVTHHWGGHALKGLDIYQRLDAALEAPPWKNRLAVTYIGNLPDSADFRCIRHLPPLDGEKLAQELRRHHFYVTGTQNEPAGMHHIEGALCGLPLLFRNSGALPEYCSPYGVSFQGPDDVLEALKRLISEHATYQQALAQYPYTSKRMVAEYLELIDRLVGEKTPASRSAWRDPIAALLVQILW